MSRIENFKIDEIKLILSFSIEMINLKFTNFGSAIKLSTPLRGANNAAGFK
jgi:hypothetical protein